MSSMLMLSSAEKEGNSDVILTVEWCKMIIINANKPHLSFTHE